MATIKICDKCKCETQELWQVKAFMMWTDSISSRQEDMFELCKDCIDDIKFHVLRK